MLSLDPPSIPKTDLVFAISANALKSQENFQQMKEIIKSMIDNYGTSSIHYAVITFGNMPNIKISFNDALVDDKTLLSLVDGAQKSSGALLDKALEAAILLLRTQGRSDAKKVIVVITDKKSGSSPNDVENQAKALENDNTKVIPVAFGKEADVAECIAITPNKENLVSVDEGDNPSVTAEIILRKALKGMISID